MLTVASCPFGGGPLEDPEIFCFLLLDPFSSIHNIIRYHVRIYPGLEQLDLSIINCLYGLL